MPKILDRLKRQLRARGETPTKAHEIAVEALQKSGNLMPGTEKATPQGKRRGGMTPGQRAKARAARKSEGRHKPSDYVYHPTTNSATLRKR